MNSNFVYPETRKHSDVADGEPEHAKKLPAVAVAVAVGETIASVCGVDYVMVRRDAIEWLKAKNPAICEKSGLCEKIGGRLYTRTCGGWNTIITPAPAAGVESFQKSDGTCKRWCGDGECKEACVSPSSPVSPVPAAGVQGAAGAIFARQLIDSGAENYIGQVFDTERGDVEVTARYTSGKTPAQKLAELEATTVQPDSGLDALLKSGLREILASAQSNSQWHITDMARHLLHRLGEAVAPAANGAPSLTNTPLITLERFKEKMDALDVLNPGPLVAAMERSMAAKQEEKHCTCPSGSGSLSWPCPAHPASK